MSQLTRAPCGLGSPVKGWPSGLPLADGMWRSACSAVSAGWASCSLPVPGGQSREEQRGPRRSRHHPRLPARPRWAFWGSRPGSSPPARCSGGHEPRPPLPAHLQSDGERATWWVLEFLVMLQELTDAHLPPKPYPACYVCVSDGTTESSWRPAPQLTWPILRLRRRHPGF